MLLLLWCVITPFFFFSTSSFFDEGREKLLHNNNKYKYNPLPLLVREVKSLYRKVLLTCSSMDGPIAYARRWV